MLTADLSGKRTLITGAASGIGLATAELFARCGATVALNDLVSNPALTVEVERLARAGLNVLAAPGDCGDAEDVTRMVKATAEAMGGLDYLINNAATPGTTTPIPPHDFAAQSGAFWQKLLAVNLLGPFHCTVAAEPYLRDGGGAIVNTASIAGISGNASSSVYAATKAALINMTAEHARAFGPEVRVNALAPGVVESNWDCNFEHEQSYIDTIPLQRAGNGKDYAEVMLFLCAGGTYVTGHTLVVDGGLTCGPRSAP